MGRLLVTAGGEPMLLSWSGSMFEYLMPLVVMPNYDNTLLDHTYRAAVARQIEYGAQRDVPWGVSESGYNAVDSHLNYQYRAFGVPAPSGDVVIAALGSLRKGGVVAINAIHLDRIPQFDYDSLLWGERQLRSVTNMTRADARDFLALAAQIGLQPRVTVFPLDQANEALLAVKNDAIDGAAVIVPEARKLR